MGKSDNIVIILVIAVAAYLYFTIKKPLEEAYKKVEGAIEEVVAIPGEVYKTTTKEVKKVVTDPCNSAAVYISPLAWAGCKVKQALTKEVQAKPEAAFDPNLIAKQAVIAKKALDAYVYPKYTGTGESISSNELCNPNSPYYVGDAAAKAGGCTETPAKQEVAAQPTEKPWHSVDYSPFSTKCPAGKTGWEGVEIGGKKWCT